MKKPQFTFPTVSISDALARPQRKHSPDYRAESDDDDNLCKVLYELLGVYPWRDEDGISYVLATDYEFSAREISQWLLYKYGTSNVSPDILESTDAVYENNVERFKDALDNAGEYEHALKVMRIYLFFHFIAFEPKHKPKATTFGKMIRELCGEALFNALANVVSISGHELIDLGRDLS